MKLTKSNLVLTKKPTNGGGVKPTVTNITQLNGIDDLERIVLNNPFNVSESSGTKEKDWISQQIFALDFDTGIDPKVIITRCRIYSIIPNIVYSSFSDSVEKRKFRVLFILDKPVSDYKMARWAQKGLMALFPESDGACKDLCRMYYNGKKVLYRLDTINDRDWFIPFCQGQVASNDRFFDKFKVSMDDKEVPRPEKVEKFDWDNAIKEIKLLDLFFNGKYRFSYELLFGLMTNAQYIYGGEKKILNRMMEINNTGGGQYFPDTSRGIEKYPNDYFLSLRNISKYNYLPKSFENFSPFQCDHDYKNLLDVKFKKGKIERLKEIEMISINDATKLLKEAFDLAKNNIPFSVKYSTPDMITDECIPYIEKKDPLFNPLPENPIYIFKITTGAGKSQAFLNENEALIALPTHRLKDEISSRMLVNHLVTPQTPTFSDNNLNFTLAQLRESGLYSEVTNIIKSISSNKTLGYTLTPDDIMLANSYIIDNKMCSGTKTTVITTHTRAVNDVRTFSHDFVIFDEDPLNNILNMDSIDIEFTAFDNTDYEEFVDSIEEFLRGLTLNAVIKMPKFTKPKGFDKFAASVGKGKLIKLLASEYVYRDVHNKAIVNFCVKKEFLPEKKIFIMSATAPIPIYKKIFGDRVIVIDITNIKPMGVIEQWTKRSYSSNGMANYNTTVYKNLFNEIEGTKVITHLKFSNRFKNHTSLDDGRPHGYYFGNCSGGDTLNGYDVSVVGTPNKPMFVYLFIAEIIGLPNSINTNLYDRVVDWNDFRFRFFTFEDQTLCDIQLSIIESEILQAAGRSRFLRNRNTTKIFSSLPLKITTKFIEK